MDKTLVERIRVAAVVMEGLPELPGYNGSILQIDDEEAANIARTLDEAAAALRATGEGECIDPNSANFKEGMAVGQSGERFLSGMIDDPRCVSCGARNAKEAATICRPDGDSCPGSEWPLTKLWHEDEAPIPTTGEGCGDHDHADFVPGCGRCAETLPEKHKAPTPAEPLRSTHHVHRGPESLPCYCAATTDHPIGREVDAAEPLRDAGAVEQTLRDALRYAGYRDDGDLKTLAERASLWMRESCVLIDMQKKMLDHPAPQQPAAELWACGFCRRTYTLDDICCDRQRDYRAAAKEGGRD